MMNQGDTGRFEEYITLRQEMLELHSFCRQILYWTVALVIASLGWYLAQLRSQCPNSTPAISGSIFAALLLTALLLSFVVYNRYLLLIFRMGGSLLCFGNLAILREGLYGTDSIGKLPAFSSTVTWVLGVLCFILQ